MPHGPSSLAKARVIPTTAAFDTVYTLMLAPSSDRGDRGEVDDAAAAGHVAGGVAGCGVLGSDVDVERALNEGIGHFVDGAGRGEDCGVVHEDVGAAVTVAGCNGGSVGGCVGSVMSQ